MKKIADFLGQVKVELAKIEWPSFDEFVGSTIVTLLLVLFFSLFIFGIDRGIAFLAKYVFVYGS